MGDQWSVIKVPGDVASMPRNDDKRMMVLYVMIGQSGITSNDSSTIVYLLAT